MRDGEAISQRLDGGMPSFGGKPIIRDSESQRLEGIITRKQLVAAISAENHFYPGTRQFRNQRCRQNRAIAEDLIQILGHTRREIEAVLDREDLFEMPGAEAFCH